MLLVRWGGNPSDCLQQMEFKSGNITLRNQFVYMMDCSLPLLEWDLPCKVNAQLTFSDDSVQLHIPPENAWKVQICLLTKQKPVEEEILNEVVDAVIALVWASGIMSLLNIELKLSPTSKENHTQ